MTQEQLEELAGLMVWGAAEPLTCDGKTYEPWEPLPSWVAGEFMGLRRRRAKTAMTDPAFRKAFAQNLDAMRNGERARNVATAVQIRDDSGDGSAAFATARLKAIATIEGRDGAATVNVHLDQSQTTNVAVAAGYVIRLPVLSHVDALTAPAAEPVTIDAVANVESER